ncbi:hypothetical protein IF188_02635 [Microbacterium sp. NEAU-LLC]|uniref:PASTA domain-containing protein n=1 Tax=Microbacterium helvum TaxID=2773713 RepID=A0ABR8NIS7_9MICO|nr:hypothetical protein [Microbacterium helvum]MBD3940595.1 hypothetical protein [Microbacterium helvum]
MAALSVVLVSVCSACAAAPAEQTAVKDSDSAAYLAENARALAASYGIDDPPDVDLVRFIALDEWAPTQRDCLREAGYDVEFTADGEGLSYPPTGDAAVAKNLNLAIYTCEMQYPVEQKYMTPLSIEQLRTLYDYRSGELLECLRREGYTSSAEPPSEQVFLQSGGQWSPYEDIAIVESDLGRLTATCPQVPANLYG